MNFDNVSRNQLCPCGSTKRFKYCHGSLKKYNSSKLSVSALNTASVFSDNGYYINSLMTVANKHICQGLPDGLSLTDKNVPPGMLISENFISDQLCRQLITQTENVNHTKATILNSDNTHPQNGKTSVVESERKTEIFNLGNLDASFKSQLSKMFKGLIKKHYNKTITSYEQPHILRYSPGGFYHLHSDSEIWDKSQKQWKRVNHRALSFIIYLNDEYTGGELVFPNFRFNLKPKKGLLVCFPSDHRFMHKAMTTTSGKRYAIVTWAAVDKPHGIEGLGAINPDTVIAL